MSMLQMMVVMTRHASRSPMLTATVPARCGGT